MHEVKIREKLKRNKPNLFLVGRNGMQKYNKQDLSMMTARLVARNTLAGDKIFAMRRINQDAEYHEKKDRPQDINHRGISRIIQNSHGA